MDDDHQGQRAVSSRSAGAHCPRWQGWLVHSFTAAGAVVGFLALLAVLDDRAPAAIGWLLVATVIDSVDGPVARSFRVAQAIPEISGCVLDSVVDFVTTVLVPLVFIWRFVELPSPFGFLVVSAALFSAALWFSRTDIMSEDNWFNGFPAAWNMVAPTLYLIRPLAAVSVVVVGGLAVLQLTSVKFVHPVRVVEYRALTLVVTIGWLLAIAFLAQTAPPLPWWGPVVLLVGPAYQAVLTVRRTLGHQGRPA